jgi:hypothetical protein
MTETAKHGFRTFMPTEGINFSEAYVNNEELMLWHNIYQFYIDSAEQEICEAFGRKEPVSYEVTKHWPEMIKEELFKRGLTPVKLQYAQFGSKFPIGHSNNMFLLKKQECYYLFKANVEGRGWQTHEELQISEYEDITLFPYEEFVALKKAN